MGITIAATTRTTTMVEMIFFVLDVYKRQAEYTYQRTYSL